MLWYQSVGGAAPLCRGSECLLGAVLPLLAGSAAAGCHHGGAAQIVCRDTQGAGDVGRTRRDVFVVVAVAVFQFLLHECRHCVDHTVRLSGDGGSHHGGVLQRTCHGVYRVVHPACPRWHSTALQGRRRHGAEHHRCGAGVHIVAHLCAVHHHREQVATAHVGTETHVLCAHLRSPHRGRHVADGACQPPTAAHHPYAVGLCRDARRAADSHVAAAHGGRCSRRRVYTHCHYGCA